MAEITASLVKQLREMTGAGMMDCKKALTETGGDLDAAVDWLRKKGQATAAKKAGRVAADGLIGVAVDGSRGALVEVNAETDFVARNETFQDFVAAAARLALEAGGSLGTLNAMAYPGAGHPVSEQLTQLIATVGENMTLRRTATVAADEGVVGVYVHNQVAAGLGKIGALVALKSGADRARLAELAKDLAMHISWAAPEAVDSSGVDPAALERERQVLTEQARESGKPEEIIGKMVEGRLRKFYQEVCLLDQPFYKDQDTSVRKVLEQAGKDLGSAVEVVGMARYKLGEGVAREESDVAAA